jgi:hypothetical protein
MLSDLLRGHREVSNKFNLMYSIRVAAMLIQYIHDQENRIRYTLRKLHAVYIHHIFQDCPHHSPV